MKGAAVVFHLLSAFVACALAKNEAAAACATVCFMPTTRVTGIKNFETLPVTSTRNAGMDPTTADRTRHRHGPDPQPQHLRAVSGRSRGAP